MQEMVSKNKIRLNSVQWALTYTH